MQSILTSAHVQHHAAGLQQRHLRLKDYKDSCPASCLVAILFTACCRGISFSAACKSLPKAPSHETARKALLFNLYDGPDGDDPDRLRRRLESALGHCITRPLRRLLRRRRHLIACDLTLRPYHGQPCSDDNEVVRGQAKSGTTHFHAYATAYLVLRGERFTLALRYVRADDKTEVVLRGLMQRCAQLGVRPKVVLLDRGYWKVAVIRYLQAARYPFAMPVITRGRKPSHPKGPSGTRVFQTWNKGGYAEYTLQETGRKGRKARVRIAVYLRYRKGRRGKRGKERLSYAFWGWQPGSVRKLHEDYRLRFGIETSYRQMNEGRARTCTRDPQWRLLLIGLALLLRNVWVWLHHEVLSSPRRGRRRYNPERLPFKRLLKWLEHEAEKALGCLDTIAYDRPPPQELLPSPCHRQP
jgi:hypothetical protein